MVQDKIIEDEIPSKTILNTLEVVLESFRVLVYFDFDIGLFQEMFSKNSFHK